jgi:hypothetical protein
MCEEKDIKDVHVVVPGTVKSLQDDHDESENHRRGKQHLHKDQNSHLILVIFNFLSVFLILSHFLYDTSYVIVISSYGASASCKAGPSSILGSAPQGGFSH